MRNLGAILARFALLLLAAVPSAVPAAHATSNAAAPGRRVAVVVGVSHYDAAGDLSSPVRNAEAMAATLGRLGYEVRLLRDARAADILAAVGALRLGPADSFAFFFSGHGVTADGAAALALPSPAPSRGGAIALLRLDAITGLVAAAKPAAALYMFDACRSDARPEARPEAASPAAKAPLAADAPGPAQPPKTLGAFFAYAAAPGDSAYDGPPGTASLSPFSSALVEELRVPGQDIGLVMRHVRERVATLTGGRQLPWSEDALTAPLVLDEAPASPELAALWGRALRGEREAERELGLAYLDGRAVGADVERGTALLREAGRQNDVPALLALGDFELGQDRSALRPTDRARADYEAARRAGSAQAAYRLAELDRRARARGAEPTAATLALDREAAAGGVADARVRLLARDSRAPASDGTSGGTKPGDAKPGDAKPDAAKRKAALAALRQQGAAGNMLAAEELGSLYHVVGSPDFDAAEGDHWLDRAIAEGSTAALLTRAKDFGEGRGRPRDEVRAHALVMQAAERGDAYAMLDAGRLLQQGIGVARDRAAALGWFRRAADSGEHEAFADLGFAYEAGAGVDRDLAEAVAAYRRGAELGDPVSTRSLAVMYENGDGVRRNIDTAITHYERARDLGDVRARASLAVLAGNGLLYSVPDPARELAMLREAVSASGDAAYIYKLARMIEDGIAAPPDRAEAARLYARAAALGSAEATTELGVMHWEGLGMPEDGGEAVALWRKAAEAGDPIAEANLSKALRLDGKTEADRLEAARWAQRSAEAGQTDAMVMMARYLLAGEAGVAQDYDAAFSWLDRSLAARRFEAAEVLAAMPNDRTIELPQEQRDRAVLTLLAAKYDDDNSLAAEALLHSFHVEDGYDAFRAARPVLLRLLDGPRRGPAAAMLGLFDERGVGGRASRTGALARYRTAAEAGYGRAWRRLADIERADRDASGEGQPQSGPRQAVEDHRRGAEAGDARAMASLAAMMRAGEGTPTDLAGAFAMLKDAAGRGDRPAMVGLAEAYRDGRGTAASAADADAWFSRAAAGDDRAAQRGLAGLLLDAPAEERDYSRGLNLLFRLGLAGEAEALGRLDGLVRDPARPRAVRSRAVFVLAVLAANKVDAAQPILDRLAAGRLVAREGKAYALRD